MLGLFKPPPVALDLGGSSLKAVCLKGSNVSLAAYLDIPEDTLNDESRLINTLRDFFKGINIIGRQAIIQMPGNLAFVRTVDFPPMPHAELREAVKWEVKRQLPYPLEEAVYDYVAVTTEEGTTVTFAAAQRRNINKHLSVFRESGVSVIAVDISPLCLMRAFKPQTLGNVIILDIGGVSTEINIIKAGILRMARTVDIGGNFIKQSLVEQGSSTEEAEKILKEGNEDALKAPLEELHAEVGRSIDYYKANFKEKTFSEVILTGGVAINIAVKNYFSHTLEGIVHIPEPFEGFNLTDKTISAIGPRFAVAIGIARRLK